VAALVLVGACSSDGGQDEETQQGREIVDLTGQVVGGGGLLGALEVERTASVMSAAGISGVISEAVDPALLEARDEVDEKLAAVARADDAEVFPAAEDVASTLVELRRDVDAVAGPEATTAQFDVAYELNQRYRAVADGFIAAGRDALPELVDDPVLREGLDLQYLSRDVIEAERDIVFWLFHDSLDDALARPEAIAELSRITTEQSLSIDALKDADHEPYRRVIESTFPEGQHQAMNEFVEQAMNGEPVALFDVLETVGGESPETAPYLALERELAVAVEAAAPAA
jgi:hypothetical protein